eukprot:jgi/Tetstr1/432749/TSEL_022115.t1
MLRFVPFAVSEFGSLAPHAEAFLRMMLRLDELDSRTCFIQQPPPHKHIPATPADGLEGDDEEDDPPPGFVAKYPGHAAFIDRRDWIDYLPRAYAESMPRPVGLTHPGLWSPRNDEWDRYRTDEKKHATRDEYRHQLCYIVFTASAHAVLTDVVATLRAENATVATPRTPTGYSTPRLARSRHIGASDQVLRWIQEGVRIPFKHNRPPPNFHNGISIQDATQAQLTFLEGELARFVESGAWEFGTCRKCWVSRLCLVPKPGVNQWRCIIDLRVLNSYCVRKPLKMETLLGMRHLSKKGDYMFSFDLQDGFYALGISQRRTETTSPWTSEALHIRQRLASLFDALGLQRNLTKGF